MPNNCLYRDLFKHSLKKGLQWTKYKCRLKMILKNFYKVQGRKWIEFTTLRMTKRKSLQKIFVFLYWMTHQQPRGNSIYRNGGKIIEFYAKCQQPVWRGRKKGSKKVKNFKSKFMLNFYIFLWIILRVWSSLFSHILLLLFS
jgi:hypothetical protein